MSKKKFKDLWKNRRERVKNSYTLTNDWLDIIDTIFKSRIENYYFKPIESILESKGGEGEGFSIVAIECLLIETFAAFRDGKCYKHGTSSGHYYGNSQKIFIDFLKNNDISIFEDNFWTRNGTQLIGTAEEFYTDVRCGLLHEAQTKGDWTINTIIGAKKRKKFLDHKDGKKQIYRTTLYYKLKEYLQEYCNELKESNGKGEELRKNLGRKLDHMFEIPESDHNGFNWWN